VRVALIGFALGVFLATSPARGDELVSNGGFETGDFTGWTVTGTGNHGTSTNTPHSGAYCAWFGAGWTYISETIPTIPGQEYFASFWISNNAGSSPQNGGQVWWNGVQLVSGQNEPSMPWTEVSTTLTATGNLTELEFAFTNGDGWWALDDVNIETAPEPQAAFFCAAGLALIGALRRRSRTPAR